MVLNHREWLIFSIVSMGAVMSQSAGKTLEVSWAPSFPSSASSFKSSVQGFTVLAPVARYFDQILTIAAEGGASH